MTAPAKDFPIIGKTGGKSSNHWKNPDGNFQTLVPRPAGLENLRKLPKGWRWVKLGDISEVVSKGTTPTSLGHTYVHEGIPFLRAEDIRGTAVNPATVAFRITIETDALLARSRLMPGDFLVTIAGTLGRVGYVPEDAPPMNCNQAVAFARLDKASVDVRFLALVCQHHDVISALMELRAGGALQNLNLQQVGKWNIPLPALAEQKRIAAMLNEQMAVVERARKAAEERLAAVNSLPSAYLRAVFPASDAPLPEGWRWVKLGDVCEINAAQVDPKAEAYRNLPHIFGESIEIGTGRLLEFRSAADDGMISGKYLFSRGAVLYSKLRPYLKKAVLADFDGLCSADMYPLSANADFLLPSYLLQVLLSEPFTQFAVAESQRARMPKLNRDQLFSYSLPLPPLPEQRRIAAILNERMAAVERARKAAEDELATIEALPAALLRRAFNGEL